jgi:hypothetical protein
MNIRPLLLPGTTLGRRNRNQPALVTNAAAGSQPWRRLMKKADCRTAEDDGDDGDGGGF